jgi:16S rRNA (guanine527-N7)-methyltransferase
VIDSSRLNHLLEPFGLDLTPTQTRQTLAYLDLLLRWNAKINLTAIRNPEEAVTRHFGESLFISRQLQLQGSLLDIGTGAGFPGLALKIVFPELFLTLLEPVTKKRAFLKEAARLCGFHGVDIRGERLEDISSAVPPPAFDFATMRAVGNLPTLVPMAAKCLKPGGKLLLWLSREQGTSLGAVSSGLTWRDPLEIPLSRTTEIWCGEKAESTESRTV